MASPDSETERIRERFHSARAAITTRAELAALRARFLNRTDGEATLAVKAIATLPVETRSIAGRERNLLKREIEDALASLERDIDAASAPAGAVDVTLPGRVPAFGRRHPLTQVRERVEDIFVNMGFQTINGPELEDDWHNFEALNMPPDHPARDMQDTLYLATPMGAAADGRRATLLRTHTSGMQIRYMESHPPPVRIIAPGRVYRRDSADATHTPMFQQVEGLLVDEGVSLADLKGTLNAFAERLFAAKVKTRFRPSFFPYTEPSAELDVQCLPCAGAGCPLCKQTGWIEILGSGMVHPAVLERVGLDSERYTGFAFGVGIERLAMFFYGVDDVRMFYENDVRFLTQVAP